jgi:hypothetical protein
VLVLTELAETLREYDADPSEETAERINALFAEMRVISFGEDET